MDWLWGGEFQKDPQLRALRTLTRQKVKDACRYKLCKEPWVVYRGWLGDEVVVVHVLGRDHNVDDVARQMLSVSHRHVAKVIGWCRDSRSIVVEGGAKVQSLEIFNPPSWQDCCHIARAVASAAAYLAKQSADVRIDYNLVLMSNNIVKLVYIPAGSDSVVYSFGRILKEVVEGPLQRLNAISADDLNDYLKAGSSALMELDQLADTCRGRNPPPMEVIEAKTVHIVTKCNEKRVELSKEDQTDLSMETVEVEQDGIDIWLITAEEIAAATANFSSSNRIGEGGFGEVFKGLHKGTPIAVKKLLPGKASKSFKQEILLLNKLRHPHILSLIGFEPSGPCLVSEYISGGSLQDYLQETGGALTWEDKVRICREMASAVAYMHSRGVVHRDLKPVNVLLDDGKRSKICDMGLAKLCVGYQANMSGMQGTYGYMDPYAVKTGLVGPYSDTYALGLIVLQLLTGMKHIRDVHNFLGQHEKQVNANFELRMESFVDYSTTVEILTKQSSSSTGSGESIVAQSGSRWEEDPDAFNDIVEHLCLKLVPRSSAMPKVALQKTVGFLLRCLERQWEYRPKLDDFLSALVELEVLASKKDLEKSDISTHGEIAPVESSEYGEGSQLAEEEKETDEQLKYLSEESFRLKAELEILVAAQEKLQQDLADIQERAETSKRHLSKLQQEFSTAASLEKFEDLTRLGDDIKLLGQAMTVEKKNKLELQMELNVLELKITENKTMAVDVDKALQKVREPVMALYESLRVLALEKQQEIGIAWKGSDLEKVMSLAKEAKTLNEKSSKLQEKYGF